MIKRCLTCGLQKNFPSNLEECPECKGVLSKTKLKDYVLYLYGKELPLHIIAQRAKLNQLQVFSMIDKELGKTGEVPRFVQTEYVDLIRPLVSGKAWDEKLKPVKDQLPKDSSYETIVYVINLVKREYQIAYNQMVETIDTLIGEEKSITEIKQLTGANSYDIELAIIKAIEKVKDDKDFDIRRNPYIQEIYVDEILRLIPEHWNGKLSSLKAELPDDCTYVTIKGVLAVNGL